MSSQRTRALKEVTCYGIAHRIVTLPKNMLVSVSRVINHGIHLLRIGGRTNQNHPQPFHHPQQQPQMVHEEGSFVSVFEQQYGTMHPFFYACRFRDGLKMAEEENKFLFVYIHSPEHPFTPSFCRQTLCSELVVEFLDANFVCWGALANGQEGLQMGTTLKVSGFPFCAVVAPAAGDNLAVLQLMEGPISPAELVEILQTTLEEQGLAFGSKLKQKQQSDRRLKEEQDIAYVTALSIDQEKERLKKNNPTSQNTLPKPKTKKPAPVEDKKAEITQILIRFPNGERREHSFLSTDKIEAIFEYIDSLPGFGGNYRLISNFPRKVYGSDQMGMSLKDAGLHHKASLFLELL